MATGKNDAANESELYSVYYRQNKKRNFSRHCASRESCKQCKSTFSFSSLFLWERQTLKFVASQVDAKNAEKGVAFSWLFSGKGAQIMRVLIEARILSSFSLILLIQRLLVQI